MLLILLICQVSRIDAGIHRANRLWSRSALLNRRIVYHLCCSLDTEFSDQDRETSLPACRLPPADRHRAQLRSALIRRSATVGPEWQLFHESLGIPPHLSLPDPSTPPLGFVHHHRALGSENTTRVMRSGADDQKFRGGTYVPSMHRSHSSNGRRSRIHRRNSGGVHRQVQKSFQSESSRSVSENTRSIAENTGEMRWLPAKRETRNTGTGSSR
jgi:hypothetical protein